MAKFLWIALWNANGLAQHKDEIQLFLQHNIIDILPISEAHFTKKSYFKIPKYNIYYANHPDGKAHARTAILVKQTTSHYELPKYEEDSPSHISSSQNTTIPVNSNRSVLPVQI